MSERATLPSAETVRRMAEALEITQYAIDTWAKSLPCLQGMTIDEEGLLSARKILAKALALYRRDLDRQKPLQQQIEEMEDGNASG